MTKIHLLIGFIFLSGATGVARAEGVVFAGTQVTTDQSYSFIGAVQPLPRAKLGQGWFVVAGTDYLTYRYNTTANGAPVTVRVTAPGVSAGFGYSAVVNNQTFELSLKVGAAF